MESIDTAKAFFKAYSNHDLDKMIGLCAPGATFNYVPYGDQGEGTVKEEGAFIWKTLIDAFPNFKAVVENTMTTEEGHLVIEAVLGGTQAKEIFGIPSKGKYQTCPHLFIMHFDHAGQISHIKGYWDNDTIYAQLGYTMEH